MSKDLILMPKQLTAENGAKGLLIGEFSEKVIMQCQECDNGLIYCEGVGEPCGDCGGSGDYAVKVPVRWDTIKEIYAMCAEFLMCGECESIYLEPESCANSNTGAMWCEDYQTCNNCGKPWVKYIKTADVEIKLDNKKEVI